MSVRQIIVRRNSFLAPLRKWAYNASGFNKYGLMHDDCLYEDEDVKEALKRLPENVLNERNYRIVRAVQLNIQHDFLPKDQWTKFEEVSVEILLISLYFTHRIFISAMMKNCGTRLAVSEFSDFCTGTYYLSTNSLYSILVHKPALYFYSIIIT